MLVIATHASHTAPSAYACQGLARNDLVITRACLLSPGSQSQVKDYAADLLHAQM